MKKKEKSEKRKSNKRLLIPAVILSLGLMILLCIGGASMEKRAAAEEEAASEESLVTDDDNNWVRFDGLPEMQSPAAETEEKAEVPRETGESYPVSEETAPMAASEEEEVYHTGIHVSESTGSIRKMSRVSIDFPRNNTPSLTPSVQQAPAVTVNWSSFASASPERQAIVNFALQYVGNPYVLGGDSLTHGIDCSGFVKKVYEHFGYSLPRISYQQAESHRRIPVKDVKPGDLMFYATNGSVYHVSMYIGDGRMVHARSKEYGIRVDQVSGAEYCAVRLLPD